MNKFRTIIVILALGTLMACENNGDGLEKQVSAIQPAQPYIPGSTNITVSAPNEGAVVSLTTTTTIDFVLSGGSIAYMSVYIFSSPPNLSGNSISNISEYCVGGVTSFLAAHSYNKISRTLANTTAGSGFYACTGDELSPLSASTKIAFTSTYFNGGGTKYYWLALGYSSNFKLTHSSPLRSFTVN